jgi:putative membrane protein
MSVNYKPATGALLLTLAGICVASAADTSSADFIKEAIQGNLAEVQVGQLAQQKGAIQGVKDFGATLVKDHQMANENATRVAEHMSVMPPDKPGLKQQAVYEKLSRLSGEKFDREFAKAMVKDHQEDIAKYQAESQRTDAASAYAKETLPKLHEHLKMAEELAQSTKVAGDAHATKLR